MDAITSTSWLMLVFSLPTQHATARMRIWRAIKALGCAALRDGVNLLPARSDTQPALAAIVDDIRQAGGSAWLLTLAPAPEHDAEFISLFDRSDDHAALMNESMDLAARLRSKSPEGLTRAIRALRRRHETLTAIDYFPSQVGEHVRLALEDLEAGLIERLSPDEPIAADRIIPTADPRDYRGRTWATRRDLWVDRVASAWLIRRHIDRKAQFLWLAKPKACSKDALGFDFDGATFTHVGHRVTFETLLAAFGLEGDGGLMRLGGVIHALDAGGVTPPEAAGLAAMLKGIKSVSVDDDDFLKRATPVFEALHAHFNEEETT